MLYEGCAGGGARHTLRCTQTTPTRTHAHTIRLALTRLRMHDASYDAAYDASYDASYNASYDASTASSQEEACGEGEQVRGVQQGGCGARLPPLQQR